MPELIEVESYRTLAELALGRAIASVSTPDAWFIKGDTDQAMLQSVLPGTWFSEATRRGKLMLLSIGQSDGAVGVLGLRFGMTGRLLVDDLSSIASLEYSSDRNDPAWDRFAVTFRDGGTLSIRDPRRLGGVEFNPDVDALGPDATAIGRAAMVELLGSTDRPVKARLLDQGRIAGLGNLLVDETLWRSGISPVRPSSSLSSDEVAELRRVMRRTIRVLTGRGGSHTGDLQDQRGPNGVCPRDGEPLRTVKVGGRTSWFCPKHQR